MHFVTSSVISPISWGCLVGTRQSLHFLKLIGFHNELLALMGRIDDVNLNEERDTTSVSFYLSLFLKQLKNSS
jgi:hypothetical protein